MPCRAVPCRCSCIATSFPRWLPACGWIAARLGTGIPLLQALCHERAAAQPGSRWCWTQEQPQELPRRCWRAAGPALVRSCCSQALGTPGTGCDAGAGAVCCCDPKQGQPGFLLPFPSCVPFIFTLVKWGQPEGFRPRIVLFAAQQLGLAGGKPSPEPCCWLLFSGLLRASHPCTFLFSAPLLLRASPGALGAFPLWGQLQAPPQCPGATRCYSCSVQEPGFLFFLLLPRLVCMALHPQAWHSGSRIRAPLAPPPCCSARLAGVSREGRLRWHAPSPCFKREEFMAWERRRMTTSWLASYPLKV